MTILLRRLFARRAFRVTFAIVAPFGVLLVGVGAFVAWPLATTTLSLDRNGGVTIVDRHGLMLRSTRSADGSDATWAPYDQIDPDLINAFVAVEDQRFWDHHGVDLRALARATKDN